MHVYYVACSISQEVCLNNEMFGVGFLFPLSFELGFVKQVYLIRAASIIWKLPHVDGSDDDSVWCAGCFIRHARRFQTLS